MDTRPVIQSAALVLSHIDRLRMQFPELADDAQLLADTIEGETDFERVVDVVLETYLDAKSMQDAADARSRSIADRARTFGNKAEAMRSILLDLMSAAGMDKLRLPVATVSVRAGLNRVVVPDVAVLPQGFTKTEITAKRAELLKALEAGDDVPGAYLEQGPTSLAIRVK